MPDGANMAESSRLTRAHVGDGPRQRRTPGRHALVWLLTAAVCLPGLLLAGTPGPAMASGSPDGSIGIRLLEAPTSLSDDPRARVYIVDHVAPGTTFTRDLEIANGTDQPREIEFYPGPAQVVDSTWVPSDAGTRSDLTRWVTTTPASFTLGAGEMRRVSATFAVPRTATAGERYGVLWASTSSTGTGDVRLVSRVGVRIYLSVGPGGEPASDFQILTLRGLRTEDGGLAIEADIQNTGERAIDVVGRLRLRDGPGGVTAGPFETAGSTTIGPGQTGAIVTTVDPELPLGPWTVVQRASSGRVSQVAEAELTLPSPGESPVVGRAMPDDAEGSWWWPLPALAGAALLAALLVWALLVRARRGRPDETGGDGEPVGA